MNQRPQDTNQQIPRTLTRRIFKAAGTVIVGLIVACVVLIAGFSWLAGMPIYRASRAAAVERVTSSRELFTFRPDRILTGAVCHYRKSNLDGTKPAEVSLYVASPLRFEVFKVYPNASAAALVTADMDWRLFSPRRLESYDVQADGRRDLVVNGQLASDDRYTFHVERLLWVSNQDFSAPIGHYPVHNYNFDLASLNFAFRHLTDPQGEFEIGVHMPCFDMLHLGRVEYLGKAKIQFQGEQPCHGRTCRKYRLDGQAFAGQVGYLWVDKEHGFFHQVEMPVRHNPGWHDFKLELTGQEVMSAEQWQAHIRQ